MTPQEEEAEAEALAIKVQHEMTLGIIAPMMIDSMTDIIARLQKPYVKLSEFQQKDLLNEVSRAIRVNLAQALLLLEQREGESCIAVKLKDFSVKGGDIALKLDAHKTIPVLTTLGAISDLTELHLFIADPTAFDDRSRKPALQETPDQASLPIDDDDDDETELEPNDDDLSETGEAIAKEKETSN